MRADKKTLYTAYATSRWSPLEITEFHLLDCSTQDAWQAVEDAAGEHCDGCLCEHCAPEHRLAYMSLDMDLERLKERVERLQKNIGRLLECVGPKTTKQALLGTIEALRGELAECVPE